jgi:hypothetical protein
VGFLAPWFLGGIALLGLPVYIHLLRQYKQTPMPFSSLMFFERRTQSSIKHRRLKYLLLFTLRCLFILLLVLAFSRPFLKSSAIAGSLSGKRVIIALDNSFSMREGDHFTQAKKDALDAVRALGVADRGQVITFGGAAKLITEMTGDKQALRAAIAAIEPGDDASSYSELSRVLRSAAESQKSDITAEVFTDLQKSSWPASFADARLDPGTKLNIHSYADKAVPNFTVESVDAPRRVFDTKKVRTLATIAGFNTPDATRTVTLIANGKTLESKQVKVPANGRAVAEFLTLDAPYGVTKCEIRIDSADAFPDDDRWLFAVERSDPKPALLVHSASDNSSPLYVRTALDAATEAAFTIDAQTPEQAAGISGAGALSKYAFVILSDPGPLPQRLNDEIEKYVQNGGSVLIALGKNAVPGAKLPATGIQLLQIHTLLLDHERPLTAGQLDNSYSSFGGGQNWDGVDFYQSAKLAFPQDSGTRVAAKLSDGSPLLIDRKNGEGHVIVFASAFDNVANNLPIQPVWLPFIEQTTHEMGGIGVARTNYRVGSYVDLRTAAEQNVPVEIIGPNNQRVLTLSESAKATTYQFPTQGFYDIRRANGREEMAAVNPDRRESDFTLVTQETLNLWKNTGTGSFSGTSATSAGNTEEHSEIWWWVLVLLALLAIAETVVGDRHLEPSGKEVVVEQ